ncbi:PD-(D/E)XK motif protein [Bacillus sp. FJAT-27445]|uniref:PD-(D/E)XK motif protein n=1 Tax=Bacillus sp. FJAT-27445 TaxID=1679166 RepID=UPI00074322F3|nr:PD-(D/E)XK motif protein [Bacillus sp. FJAT-27445]
MKITPEILEKQWKSIKYTDGGFLQIDTQHPLEWHIGYQSISQRTFLLVSDTEIGTIESSKSMKVSRRMRETDNRWTLSFELLRNEQQGVFAILCCDVMEHSRLAANEEEALKLVIMRYKQWSKLLETQRSGLMDEYRRKGLLGELLFLEQRLAAYAALATVQGWSGADGGDQDFVYPDGWFEIKSIGVSAVSVTISSMDQLDCVDDGELVIKRIDKVAPDKPGAVSLNDVVRRISTNLMNSVEALDLFRAKLNAYGYIDLREYSEQKYFCSGRQRYRVDEFFPKLTKANVPTQVSSLHYEINLPSLVDWQKE